METIIIFLPFSWSQKSLYFKIFAQDSLTIIESCQKSKTSAYFFLLLAFPKRSVTSTVGLGIEVIEKEYFFMCQKYILTCDSDFNTRDRVIALVFKMGKNCISLSDFLKTIQKIQKYAVFITFIINHENKINMKYLLGLLWLYKPTYSSKYSRGGGEGAVK